jgi:hypothetical protein
MRTILLILISLIFFITSSCNSSTVKDAIGIIEGVPRKTIDTSILGINAFVNDSRFGSIPAQFQEVRDVIGIRYVRVLIQWDERVQPVPGGEKDFSFYDAIIDSLPAGVEALVIISGLPSWMSNSANWIDGDARRTFHNQWVRPVVRRYGGKPRVRAFQVWNEPNMISNPQNGILGFDSPVNYIETLALAHNFIKENAPSKLVVNAATTAINQNYPATLDYNRSMRDAGLFEFIDIFAMHYYGRQFENVVRPGGVASFLNSIPRPIWVTESGSIGVDQQLAYGEQVWPYLTEQISGITRIYIYQFTDNAPLDGNYGLKNLSGVTDLYIHLRDRKSASN